MQTSHYIKYAEGAIVAGMQISAQFERVLYSFLLPFTVWEAAVGIKVL